MLVIRLEVALRHDEGKTETGHGGGHGGRPRVKGPGARALDLSAYLYARGLIAHESSGLRDRGLWLVRLGARARPRIGGCR